MKDVAEHAAMEAAPVRHELYRIECRGPPGAWTALDQSAFRPLITSFRVASA